jgi:hypothetical protein
VWFQTRMKAVSRAGPKAASNSAGVAIEAPTE